MDGLLRRAAASAAMLIALAPIGCVRADSVVRAWGGRAGWDGWKMEGAGWQSTTRQRDSDPAPGLAHVESSEMETGAYRSPVFTVRGDRIRFLINGWDRRGNDVRAGGVSLRLASDGRILRSVAPPQQNGFVKQEWLVRDLKGQSVYLEAADRLSEPGYAWIGLAGVEEIAGPKPTRTRPMVALRVPSAEWGTWAVLTHDAVGRPTEAHLSSAACGEIGAGSMRSPEFTAGREPIRILARGWDGPQGGRGRNKIELIDAQTGEVLRSSAPPLTDTPMPVVWETEGIVGREVAIQVTDADTSSTYAWMGIDEIDAGPAFRVRLDSAASMKGWRSLSRPSEPAERFGLPFLCYQGSLVGGVDGARIDVRCRASRIYLLGMNPPENWVMVGDSLGSVKVRYADGVTESYPIIIGEGAWWGYRFAKYPEPFVSFPKAREAFRKALRLYPAAPVDDGLYVATIRPRQTEIASIEISGDPTTRRAATVRGITIDPVPGTKAPDGIVMGCGAIPAGIASLRPLRVEGAGEAEARKAIQAVREVMYCVDTRFPTSFALDMPKGYAGPQARFEGDRYAEALTNIFHYNVADMALKVDGLGVYHTGTKQTAWYGYDGFGAFTTKGLESGMRGAGFYYEEAWTRDMGRSLGELVALGYLDKAKLCADFAFRSARVWEFGRGNNLLLNGQRLPRHICRILQMPSTGVGSGCFENDGHGLTSLAVYNLWRRLPERDRWLRPRWRDVKGLGDWVVWQLDHPELSRSENGLLWSDSEGSGWDAGTGPSVYCDVACIEALYGLAEMAESIGETASAEKWRATASRLRDAGERGYVIDDPQYGRTWTLKNAGWGGQSVLGPLIIRTDRLGFATGEDDLGWLGYDRAAYERNRATVGEGGALGYTFAFTTQAALLLDRMSDATRRLEVTCRAVYNPTYRPYLIPESSLPDPSGKTFARMGELGNGVQQAENIKALRIVLGIDDSRPTELRIIPRIPVGWTTVSADRFPAVIERGGERRTASVSYKLRRTADGMAMELVSDTPLPSIRLRLGAFAEEPSGTRLLLNGAETACTVERSGDSWWLSAELPDGMTGFRVEMVKAEGR